MDRMRFMVFTWDHDPEEFRVEAICEPEYTINDVGRYEYVGLGPLCRVISGRGVFSGPDANQNFNALSVLMAHCNRLFVFSIILRHNVVVPYCKPITFIFTKFNYHHRRNQSFFCN